MDEASDERTEWIVFSRTYWAQTPAIVPCSCQFCVDRHAVQAWAQGKHTQRPPDTVLRDVLNRVAWGR